MTTSISTAAPPSTADVSSEILSSIAATSGVLTDDNAGSQVRSFSEATGAVVEQQGVWTQATAYESGVYGALQAFGIYPNLAVPASGPVTFATSFASGATPISQNVTVPSGTIVQTAGAVQFLTTADTLLASGSVSVTTAVVAASGGAQGNVPALSINQIVSGLSYPLFVMNQLATSGGVDAETPSQTLARFAAERASIPASTPNAIANAAIGVMASGSGETVLYSTLQEPFLAGGPAGWNLFLDNGTGTASSGLIAAVNAALFSTPSNPFGYRDAGVPYTIQAVTPTFAVVTVSGTVMPTFNVSSVSGQIAAAVSGYFTLAFGTPAEQAQIAAVVANGALGGLSSLTVQLMVQGSATAVTGVVPAPTGRVLLGALFQSLGS